MHGSTSTRIKMMIKDLQRNCFLIVSEKGIISVHDVYLEFAMSIENGISKFLNSTIKWCWKVFEFMGLEAEREEVLLKEGETTKPGDSLRTLILQEGKGCKRVDLQGFPCLKVVVLKNCRTLKVLGLSGLSSLVCLGFENCESLQKVECNDVGYLSLNNVKKLRIVQSKGEKSNLFSHISEWEEADQVVEKSRAIVPKQFNALASGIAWQMRSLQVVYLQNTGIKGLENVGSYWPQLEDLSVIEGCLESLHLGNLPYLKRFWFSDHLTSIGDSAWPFSDDMKDVDRYQLSYDWPYNLSYRWAYRKGNGRLMLRGKDLLAGCPQLKEVAMELDFFQLEGDLGTLPSNLAVLKLHCFFTATELPDLSLLEQTLEWLNLQWCEQLRRVAFHAAFKNLGKLTFHQCLSLVEVSGLEFLPNLQDLHVLNCPKLHTLRGFDNSNMLQCLWVEGCQELQEISCVTALMSLKELVVWKCSWNLANIMASADLQNLVRLRTLSWDLGRDSCLSVKNLENLDFLKVHRESGLSSSIYTRGILEGLEDIAVNLKAFIWRGESTGETLIHANSMTLGRYIPSIGCLCSIQTLDIIDECGLGSMDGIEHLLTLEAVSLTGLKNLRSVRALMSLGRLCEVSLKSCLVLEELPCLFNTTLLIIEDCPNLKVVEGCGTDGMSTIRLEELRLLACLMLEELPSLKALVNLVYLCITDCPKLKAVEGCHAMRCLFLAEFDGCKSIACFPLDLESLPRYLSFRGCKFARNLDVMVAWACDKKAPRSVHAAAVDALLWEYYQKDANKQGVVEHLFSCFLSLIDDKCMDLEGIAEGLERFWISMNVVPFPAPAAVRNLEVELGLRGKLITKRGLLQESHRYQQSLCRFLDDVHVTTLITEHKWLHLRVFHGELSVIKVYPNASP